MSPLNVWKQPRRVNTGGGGFLLNPPAPSATPTSFKDLAGYDGSVLNGCPQSSIAPCFRLSVERGPVTDPNDFLDPTFTGEWILQGGYVEPENYIFYRRYFPTFVGKSTNGRFSDSIKWQLFYGRIGLSSGPYWVPGGEPTTFGETWHLLSLPEQGPLKVYLLWGVESQDPDLEPLPDLPNPDYDPELVLPLPEGSKVDDYQNEEYYRWIRNFRDVEGDYSREEDGKVFNPLGSNLFRVFPEFQDIRRNTRLLDRPANEFLRVSAYWP